MEHNLDVSLHEIPLTDPSLLRGTSPCILLERFGTRLRSTVGGIGSVAVDADQEYDKSFPCEELSLFFSHSWHARWYWKYLTLLFFFNVKAALTISMAAGIIASLVHDRGGVEYAPNQLCWDDSMGSTIWEVCYTSILKPLALCLLTFVGTLLTWHHIEAFCRCSPSLFLDKICIHQTDLVKKEAGIKAIGAILNASDTMLVTWDPTYFRRLWCVYELSAFKYSRPNARIIIRSMMLPPTCFALIFVCSATYSLLRVIYTSHTVGAVEAFVWVPLLPLARVVFRIRSFARERADLKQQLRNFSVRNTLCFDESDRVHVYDSIAKWHGRGQNEDVGLDNFDQLIRSRLKKDLHRTLGKSWAIPYEYAMVVGLLPFHLYLVWSRNCSRADGIIVAFELILFRFPLCAALTLGICALQVRLCPITPPGEHGAIAHRSLCDRRTLAHRLADVIAALICAGGVIGFTFCSVYVDSLHGRGWFGLQALSPQYLSWLILQAVLVVLFYKVLVKWHWKKKVRQATNTARRKSVELVHHARRRSGYISERTSEESMPPPSNYMPHGDVPITNFPSLPATAVNSAELASLRQERQQ